MVYHLEGRLLEVCNCRVLCPCWIGEDPDRGTCEAFSAYHIGCGTIRGVDVSGLSIHEKTRPNGRTAVPQTGIALLAAAATVLAHGAYAS